MSGSPKSLQEWRDRLAEAQDLTDAARTAWNHTMRANRRLAQIYKAAMEYEQWLWSIEGRFRVSSPNVPSTLQEVATR